MKKIVFIFLVIILHSCSSERPQAIEETIVIGGGLMGSASSWQLTQQGHKVLLLEQQDSVYTYGSSFGAARIARSNNRGNDIWSYLHNRSIHEVQLLINYLNEDEKSPIARMEDVYTTLPVTYVGRISIYNKLIASLKRQNIDYEMATSYPEGLAKFDVILPDSVLIQREFNKHSGMINPEKLIELLHLAINKKKSTIRYNTRVNQINYNGNTGLFEVDVFNRLDGKLETLFTRKVITAAGAYSGTLLKGLAPYIDSLVTPQRVFLAFLKIKPKKYNSLTLQQKDKLANFYPVINSSTGTRQGSFFSMIEYYDEKNHPVFKIGGHFQRSPISDLSKVWALPLAQDEKEWSLKGTERYFKLLKLPLTKDDLVLEKGYSCVYSLTSSEVPIVSPMISQDGSPSHNGIIMAGMSGVGAKGAMTYGLIAANLMNNKTETDSLYKVTAKALGFERLLADKGK